MFGGDVRNRTGVQNQATPNVYMLREVVKILSCFTQLAKLHKTSLESSYYAETDIEYISIGVILRILLI